MKYPASRSHIYNNTIVGNSARRGPYHGLGGGIIFGVGPADEDVFYKNNIIAFNPYGGGGSTVPFRIQLKESGIITSFSATEAEIT